MALRHARVYELFDLTQVLLEKLDAVGVTDIDANIPDLPTATSLARIQSSLSDSVQPDARMRPSKMIYPIKALGMFRAVAL